MIPSSLEKAIYGVYATHALHLADKHNVFAYLAEKGAAAPGEIAKAVAVDGETLERLMLVLGALELVQAGSDGKYRLREGMGPYLDKKDPRYVGGFVTHLINSTSGRMGHLDAYLSKGKAVVDAALPSPFDVIYKDEASTKEFMDAMWQLSFDVSRELVKLAGLDSCRQLVDVGGASGPFSVAALQHSRELRSTLFDLPKVGRYVDETRRTYGLEERLRFVPGDFFREELPEGDCFAFGYILSDWDDATCLELLRKAHRACRAGGRVLVMERLFDEDKRGPFATVFMNLSMHVETQGRHRTAREYVGLLEAAGFRGCEVRRSSRDKHLVIGLKHVTT
uniref:O-methyltransferase n=2 Tax=Bacteria TaxID=2 RepID=A0A4D6NZD5_9BACT|nr:O-methyltransferase [Cystobacter sp. SBCb004]QCE43617.1 O-methyltransferase [Expression vector pArg2345-V2]QCE43623.1 O-methyltransferase [Expression vector pArg2345-V1]QCE43629.1 O-methyltransferase [Expression vector pArg2345-V1-BsaI]UEN69759.1 O-methyltransferase [Cloning vector pArg2345-V1-BsaI-PnptII]UEN69765.1 O-methyltransferase [Cloning vector pArg2345-V1-BsaI-Ppm]UEN69771.1 O-methyltransferase [Cloning vector pArg2345-V1-BsaI-Ptet]UEN69778.1 O-methyltransferase [Cloning vector pA